MVISVVSVAAVNMPFPLFDAPIVNGLIQLRDLASEFVKNSKQALRFLIH